MNEGRLKKILIILGGLIALAFVSSFFVVRMTDPPEFCIKCHIMQPMYDSFIKSSHSSLTCNDCHTPHESYLAKVFYKGTAGMWDAYIFYTGQTPQVIETKPKSKKIIKSNCIRCHEDVVSQIDTDAKDCFSCHRYLPHGGGEPAI